MTEALQKFIQSVPVSYCGGDWIQAPENVLRAFAQEVMDDSRANMKAPPSNSVGFAFMKRVRDFGLDGEK